MTTNIKPPPLHTLVGEGLSGIEMARLLASSPSLARQARGDGDPVLVLPGLGTSNLSTGALRAYLSWLGYSVQGWQQGRNEGDVATLLPMVREEVRDMYQRHGNSVHIVGWSLGGVLAREVAREDPDHVRQVITMGSPLAGGPKYTSFARLYEARGADLEALEQVIAERESRPIRVPVTSIYSRRDGIVAWQASIDRHTPEADNVEVRTTHLGFGISPDVFKLLAAKLSRAPASAS